MVITKKALLTLIVSLLILAFFTGNVSAYYEVSAAGGCKVPDSHPDAWRFLKKIKSYPTWEINFYLLYGYCREKYYKSRWLPDGYEYVWIDSSDIHYHVSHGGPRWDPYFGSWLTAVIFQNGDSLVPGEATNGWPPWVGAWGNEDLEWIGFRCCQLLDDASWWCWARSMNRLHLFLGFKTSSFVHDSFGEIWATGMRAQELVVGPGTTVIIPGRTVTQAFFSACDRTQPRGVVARSIAETLLCYSDHLWGNGFVSPDPVPDFWKWCWSHQVGSPDYLDVNDLSTMYVYEVAPRDVNEAYIRHIGNAFGFSTSDDIVDLCCETGTYVMVRKDDPCDCNSDSHVLEVQKSNGRYYYYDLGRLWRVDPCDANATIFDPNVAVSTATGHLTTYNLYPTDTGAGDVEIDYIVRKDTNDPCSPNEMYPQHTCVVYERQLVADGGRKVSVAGPGGRMKVYLDGSGTPTGAMGNWRPVQASGSVSVMDKEEIWDLYQQHGEKIAVTSPYLEYDTVITDANTATLAYYEHAGSEFQNRLIPVWIFDAQYFKDGNSVTTTQAFLPVNRSFCKPVVTITSPMDQSEYGEGAPVPFQAVVDANYGTPPCSYEWATDVDGVLSRSLSFTTDSLTVNCDSSCNVITRAVTLTVTDSEGLQAVETVNVKINGVCPECPDPADLNGDGTVDFGDFAIIAEAWMNNSYQERP